MTGDIVFFFFYFLRTRSQPAFEPSYNRGREGGGWNWFRGISRNESWRSKFLFGNFHVLSSRILSDLSSLHTSRDVNVTFVRAQKKKTARARTLITIFIRQFRRIFWITPRVRIWWWGKVATSRCVAKQQGRRRRTSPGGEKTASWLSSGTVRKVNNLLIICRVYTYKAKYYSPIMSQSCRVRWDGDDFAQGRISHDVLPDYIPLEWSRLNSASKCKGTVRLLNCSQYIRQVSYVRAWQQVLRNFRTYKRSGGAEILRPFRHIDVHLFYSRARAHARVAHLENRRRKARAHSWNAGFTQRGDDDLSFRLSLGLYSADYVAWCNCIRSCRCDRVGDVKVKYAFHPLCVSHNNAKENRASSFAPVRTTATLFYGYNNNLSSFCLSNLLSRPASPCSSVKYLLPFVCTLCTCPHVENPR